MPRVGEKKTNEKPMDIQSVNEESMDMNLPAIKRIDNFAESLMEVSPFVSLYKFDNSRNKWEKQEIEGPFFIYKRVVAPPHSFLIANRQSLKDFIQPIHRKLRFRYEAPFIYIYEPKREVMGMSFTGEDECKKIYALLSTLETGEDSVPSEEDLPSIDKLQLNLDSIPALTPQVLPQKFNSGNICKVLLRSNDERSKTNARTHASCSEYEEIAQKKLPDYEGEPSLKTVQQIDPFAGSVIAHSSHVELYEFSHDLNVWEKSNIGGPLFVYKRLDYPLHSFAVISSKQDNNFVVPLDSRDGVTLRFVSPYIFVYKKDRSIRSLWFFNNSECKRIFDCLTKYVRSG